MIYVGLQYTAATNGVLFNSVTPILIMVISWLAFRERLGPWQDNGRGAVARWGRGDRCAR